MTTFIDVAAVGRLLQQHGMQPFMAGMADTIRQDFLRWEAFDKCPRVASHSETGVIELMPVADVGRYAFKYVNGHPSNTARGLSTVMAFGALADVDTGYPTLISELTLTTAFRTAATSAMAAQVLARPDAAVMGMIGCGAQSEFQALAFHSLLGIRELRIFDIDAGAVDKLRGHLADYAGLKVIVANSAHAAADGADIVTTCTADKAWATILTPDMVQAGMHINAVGGDCPGKTELHAAVLQMAKIFVEYEPQTRVEGDIQQLPAEHPVTELWQVISGNKPGRDRADQITVFDSVGFALEDFSALRYVQQLARRYGEGETIALIPELSDPKDLFSLLRSPHSVQISSNAA
ncbi:MAG: ornithine cyclodeaminase [Gammaproteobacteria bacterium]|nr:ornithine cyclodeaminase [Gammaproteobacteria bacterium]